MTERLMTWNGAERRTGAERRVAVMERTVSEERRHEERRRGGTGTHRPDPLDSLLAGLEPQRDPDVQAEPAVSPAGDRRRTMAALDRDQAQDRATVGLATRLRPAHEPHDAIPSVAAVNGHPVHPMLVPLPIGAFVGALACDVAFAATGDRFFGRASRLLTGTALATGVVAALPGAIDFWGRGAIRAHAASWIHAAGNLAALGIGAASLTIRAAADDERRAVLPAGLAMSAAAGTALLVTGWLGGELSYRHRVGIIAKGEA